MKHADDMQNPITDECAAGLYIRTPIDQVPEAAQLGEPKTMWERASPAMRDVFRARARRFLAGDLTVEPWRFTPHPPARVD